MYLMWLIYVYGWVHTHFCLVCKYVWLYVRMFMCWVSGVRSGHLGYQRVHSIGPRIVCPGETQMRMSSNWETERSHWQCDSQREI